MNVVVIENYDVGYWRFYSDCEILSDGDTVFTYMIDNNVNDTIKFISEDNGLPFYGN